MRPKKKQFNPPKHIFVIFDTITGHVLDSFPTRADLDIAMEDLAPQDDEVVVEYVLPAVRTPKSKEL